MAVDVLIQTYNEEINLPHTLRSVAGWARRIFVVDSGSTDRTCDIAREFGAEVVHHDWEGYARQKNWALANLPFEADWILILDADEAVSEELRDEILDLVSRPAASVKEAGFNLNRIFIFMGREIRHCGYFPSWNLRLFKRGMARYEDRSVHEHMICDGQVGRLKHLLLHEDRRGFEHLVAKHNRYSTLEAEEIFFNAEPWPGLGRMLADRTARRRFVKSRVAPFLPIPWLWRLLYMYVLRLGFLDGRAGWMLCNFICSYEFFVHLKYREIRRMRGNRVLRVRGLAEAEGVVDINRRQTTTAPGGGGEGALPYETMPATNPPEMSGVSSGPVEGGAELGPHGLPTLVTREGRAARREDSDESLRFVSPWSLREKVGRVLWMVVSAVLFRPSFHNFYGWRRMLLRLFGARIGRDVRIRPTVNIEIPWNIEIGDGSVIGDHAILYSLGPITIGRRAVVSQYAHLCAGTHDHRYRDFPLLRPPVVIGDEAWIAADAFVGPGVTIGDRVILGARASAFRDVPSDVIAVGNPAKPACPRTFGEDEPSGLAHVQHQETEPPSAGSEAESDSEAEVAVSASDHDGIGAQPAEQTQSAAEEAAPAGARMSIESGNGTNGAEGKSVETAPGKRAGVGGKRRREGLRVESK